MLFQFGLYGCGIRKLNDNSAQTISKISMACNSSSLSGCNNGCIQYVSLLQLCVYSSKWTLGSNRCTLEGKKFNSAKCRPNHNLSSRLICTINRNNANGDCLASRWLSWPKSNEGEKFELCRRFL